MAKDSLDEQIAKNVLKQVEFYFGDSNLPRDKFLKKSIEESEDGLVSLALICSFSLMKSHLGLVDMKPEDVPKETVLAVANALRKSSFLKISVDGDAEREYWSLLRGNQERSREHRGRGRGRNSKSRGLDGNRSPFNDDSVDERPYKALKVGAI